MTCGHQSAESNLPDEGIAEQGVEKAGQVEEGLVPAAGTDPLVVERQERPIGGRGDSPVDHLAHVVGEEDVEGQDGRPLEEEAAPEVQHGGREVAGELDGPAHAVVDFREAGEARDRGTAFPLLSPVGAGRSGLRHLRVPSRERGRVRLSSVPGGRRLWHAHEASGRANEDHGEGPRKHHLQLDVPAPGQAHQNAHVFPGDGAEGGSEARSQAHGGRVHEVPALPVFGGYRVEKVHANGGLELVEAEVERHKGAKGEEYDKGGGRVTFQAERGRNGLAVGKDEEAETQASCNDRDEGAPSTPGTRATVTGRAEVTLKQDTQQWADAPYHGGVLLVHSRLEQCRNAVTYFHRVAEVDGEGQGHEHKQP